MVLYDSVQGMRMHKLDGKDDADPLQLVAERFAPRTTDSFERWCRDRLDTWLTPQQKMINTSMINNRYTAVPSCHASGKSRIAAMSIGHFLDSHQLGSAFCVSTAPSSAQVESVLWRELIRIHAQAGLRGRITRGGFPQWHVGDQLIAFGRHPKDMASLQGIHAKYVLLIIEEADGIGEELWIAMDTLASSGNVRLLAIGNPDSADSHFAKVIRPGSGWNVIPIDGLRTPNFTRVGVAKYPELRQYMSDHDIPFADTIISEIPPNIKAEWRESLLSPEWVAERMPRWGVKRIEDPVTKKIRWNESSLWQSKVRGRAPEEGAEGLIPLSWVEAANRRWLEWQANGAPTLEGRTILGCDVADSGKDETVMPIRRNWVIETLNRVGQQDTETTSMRLAGILRTVAGSIACVDAGGGYGVGVINRLRSLHLPVISYMGSMSGKGLRDKTGEFTFVNVRSAAYWHVRELLDPVNGPNQLALPPDEDLITDLTVPHWKVRTGAVIEVEPKVSVNKRLKRSPDCGDAVVMCCWPSSSNQSKITVHSYSSMRDGWTESFVSNPHPSAAQLREQRIRQLADSNGKTTGRRIFSYIDSNGWN